MRHKTILAIGIFFILAVASRWLLIQNLPPDPETGTAIDLRFDYSLNTIEVRLYDATGSMTAQLKSDSFKQDAKTFRAHLLMPRITVYSGVRNPTSVRADTADFSADRETVFLNGNIRLHQTDGRGRLSLLTMDTLELNLPDGTASSATQVELLQAGSQLRGLGLRANIHERHFQLLSEVVGFYEVL